MKTLFATASVAALLAIAPAGAQAAETQHLSQQDQTFVKEAGAGSLAEAELGKLAMEKSATPAIREFGRWMYTDHGLTANNWLKAIMADQNQSFQPTLTAQDRDLKQKLQGLNGQQFDQQYIQSQVSDHEQTIPKFEREARDGQNPMVKNFAQSLVPVLREHLAEAKSLAAGAPRMAGERSTAIEHTGSSTPPR